MIYGLQEFIGSLFSDEEKIIAENHYLGAISCKQFLSVLTSLFYQFHIEIYLTYM